MSRDFVHNKHHGYGLQDSHMMESIRDEEFKVHVKSTFVQSVNRPFEQSSEYGSQSNILIEKVDGQDTDKVHSKDGNVNVFTEFSYI